MPFGSTLGIILGKICTDILYITLTVTKQSKIAYFLLIINHLGYFGAHFGSFTPMASKQKMLGFSRS